MQRQSSRAERYGSLNRTVNDFSQLKLAIMIKNGIRRLLRSNGFDLHRFNPETSPASQIQKSLQAHAIDLVLDVGANVGQFVLDLRSTGFTGRVVSFEPLSSAHSELSAAARQDPLWTVHSRCAIGDRDGEVEINVSGNSVSSSVLPMMDSHRSAAAGSAYVGIERIPILMLDTVAPLYLADARRPLLKIDTQGFEWQVLDGARGTLQSVRGVLCELSMVPLYEGQRLWLETIQRLEGLGFALWALQSGFADPRDGRGLQMDGLFFRRG